MIAGWSRRRVVQAALASVAFVVAAAAAEPPADLRVNGLGWIGDHKMRQTLILLLGSQRGPVLDANALDDAAMILFSNLNEEGYLKPMVGLEIRERDGRAERFILDPTFETFLPRWLVAAQAAYTVTRGRRFTMDRVDFEGLKALSKREARSFFRSEGLLFNRASDRAYSRDRLKRSCGNLLDSLHRRGYAEAAVEPADLRIDAESGRVEVKIVVREGPRWMVTGLKFAMPAGESPPQGLEKGRLGQPWSSLWRQDFEAAIRRWYYEHGHPDIKIEAVPEAGPVADGQRSVIAIARLDPGPEVRLGRTVFVGNARTRTSILRPLVHAKPGDPLNLLALEDAQVRLSHLGVFRSIDLGFDPPSGTTRDAVFRVSESELQEADLLFGYGSFDQLRGGVELHNTDLFGLAHSSTLELVQSMKSSKGEYDYTIPELFGTSVDGTARLFGLQRRERSFLAEEYGSAVSFSWPIRSIGVSAVSGYTFERLKNLQDTLATFRTDQGQANAASLNLGLTFDRLDNPLDPRHGYKLFFHGVEASRYLGGQVDFQQFELSASYHTRWGDSRWIHLGFTHDVVTTLGSPNDLLLPVNVRFYPGGDQSIRGYGLGEAAPRDPTGQFVGAKSVVLFDLELEQALTPKISLVAFSDSLGTAASLAHYPFDERLYSVGLGVRYRTLIGPVRVEYGHNLNPRPGDPSGTLLLSVGFPF